MINTVRNIIILVLQSTVVHPRLPRVEVGDHTEDVDMYDPTGAPDITQEQPPSSTTQDEQPQQTEPVGGVADNDVQSVEKGKRKVKPRHTRTYELQDYLEPNSTSSGRSLMQTLPPVPHTVTEQPPESARAAK